MHEIKLVIVPAWLNLITKELGVTNDDLADWKKLSDILSPRDLLIYKMVNFQAADMLKDLVSKNGVDAFKLLKGFTSTAPTPTLMERASLSNIENDTYLYGATHTRDKEQGLCTDVAIGANGVLYIHLIPYRRASKELQENTETLAEKICIALFNYGGLGLMVKSGAFKEYAKEFPFDPISY